MAKDRKDLRELIEEKKRFYQQELLQKRATLRRAYLQGQFQFSAPKSKIILWDWDNTLADTFPVIRVALDEVRSHYGLPALSQSEAKLAMNQSIMNTATQLVGPEKAQEFNSFFWNSYLKNMDRLKLLPGAEDMLKYAHSQGFVNILASNKESSILSSEAKQLNVSSYFDKIIGAGDAPQDKPSKAFTDKAMEGYNSEAIISIGDGISDIKMARNYPKGVSILVSTLDEKEFSPEKPDYWVQDLRLCKPVLQRLTHQTSNFFISCIASRSKTDSV